MSGWLFCVLLAVVVSLESDKAMNCNIPQVVLLSDVVIAGILNT